MQRYRYQRRHHQRRTDILGPSVVLLDSWLLVGILSIFIPFADGICRKDPWNWEYDCAESNVAAKKALLEKEAAEAQQ